MFIGSVSLTKVGTVNGQFQRNSTIKYGWQALIVITVCILFELLPLFPRVILEIRKGFRDIGTR